MQLSYWFKSCQKYDFVSLSVNAKNIFPKTILFVFTESCSHYLLLQKDYWNLQM